MNILQRLNPFRALAAASGRGERRSSALLDGLRGAPNLTRVNVNEKSALTLTAAYAAINVIATDVSCLPLKTYKRRKDGGRDEVTDHPASDLLKWSPNGESPAMRWRQANMGHALGWGNGYAEIERDGYGRPVGLHLIDPSTVEPKRRKSDRKLYYELADRTVLRPDQVLHLAMLGFDGLSGYSPVRMARQAIGLGLAAETFGAALFGNGSMARGFLKTPQKLSAEARQRLREQFESVHQGVYNAHRLAVLEQGLDWVQTSINPDDAQFLATRQFQVIEIARMYRIPPHKLGDFSQAGSAYNALEESNLDYLGTTLMPWCEAYEGECNLKLLTAQERADGYYIEHVLLALLRGNMAARGDFYMKLIGLGVFTPNMIAQLENMNPTGPEGDRHYISVNLVPSNMAGMKQAPTSEVKSNAVVSAA